MNDNKNFLTQIGNLLQRASARLRTSKIVKKVGALGIAVAIGLNLGSCDLSNLPIDPPYSNNGNQNQGNNNQNQNNNQNNNNQNNNNQNNNENNNQNNNQNENQIDLSQYSELLQSLLTNPEYQDFVEFMDGYGLEHHNSFIKPKAHPYAFLEDEGYDIEAIKNGTLESHSMSYILDSNPNDLYIGLQIQNEDNYDVYLIKYTLTDKEVEDYKMLHLGSNNHPGTFYFQAMFMNDIISQTREPEVISKTAITIDSYDKIFKSMNNGIPDEKLRNFILTKIDTENSQIQLITVPYHYDNLVMTYDSILYSGTLMSGTGIDVENNTYLGPNNWSHLIAVTSSPHDATFFLTDKITLAYQGVDLLDKHQ